MTKIKVLPPATLVALAVTLCAGCASTPAAPLSSVSLSSSAVSSSSSEAEPVEVTPEVIEEMFDDIFSGIDIMMIGDVTEQEMTERYKLTDKIALESYARLCQGRFGVADLFVVKPAEGMGDTVKTALKDIQDARIKEFENYNIEGSYDAAVAGEVFQQGDYVCLAMFSDKKPVKEKLRAILGESIK